MNKVNLENKCNKWIINTIESIHCDICKCKHHVKCAKISIPTYEGWLSGTSNVKYICDSCSLISPLFNPHEAINSPFECFEQNDHSEFVQFPLAIIEDWLKYLKTNIFNFYISMQDPYCDKYPS